jgi:hypothetical protein
LLRVTKELLVKRAVLPRLSFSLLRLITFLFYALKSFDLLHIDQLADKFESYFGLKTEILSGFFPFLLVFLMQFLKDVLHMSGETFFVFFERIEALLRLVSDAFCELIRTEILFCLIDERIRKENLSIRTVIGCLIRLILILVSCFTILLQITTIVN